MVRKWDLLITFILCAAIGCSRNADQAGSLQYVWGRSGLMDGQFRKPRAIVTDKDDHHFIVDFRAKIQVFTTDGKFLRSWATPIHEIGRPSGLGLDRQGNLLVADSHYHRILVYRPEGTLLHSFGGESGTGPLVGQFGYIGDIAVDSKGNYYIAESQQNERITKVSPKGEILKRWGDRGPEPGNFMRIRAMCFDDKDQLYVADACNHRIQIFDSFGNLLRIIGEPGDGHGQLRYPYDVAIAPDRSFYVCEYGNNRVQRFSEEGKPLGTWGQAGRGEGELWNPWALSVDSKGNVVVVDSNNHRIQVVTF